MERKSMRGRRKRQTTKGKSQSEWTGQVRSLSKALSIAREISRNAAGLGLTDIARRVELPISTVHRLLTTLEQERFVRFDRERSAWLVGVDAFVIGIAFIQSRDVVSVAQPFLRMLMEESGETANLVVLEGVQALYLSQVESRHSVRVIANPGQFVELHSSAVGKVILSYLPHRDLVTILKDFRLQSRTTQTINTPEMLLADIELIRGRGYSIDDEEHTADVRCVAAAVFNENCLPVAAVSLSGPKTRITADRVSVLGTLVNRIARQITAAFGGRDVSLRSEPHR